MNGPQRWTEDPAIAEELGAAIRHERAQGPSNTQLDDLAARVLAQLAAPGPDASAGGSTTAPTAKAAVLFSAKNKTIIGISVLCIAGWWASSALTPVPSLVQKQPVHATRPAPIVRSPAAAPTPSSLAPAPSVDSADAAPQTKALRVPKKRAPRAPDVQAQQLVPVSEVVLLQRARRVVLHDPEGALALVREHEQFYAQGTFREEREALAVEALWRAGKKAEATARFRIFVARYPSSAYRERIEPWFTTD